MPASEQPDLPENHDEAVEAARRMIEAAASDSAELRSSLETLATHLLSRFEHANRLADLDESIQTTRRAIAMTPADDPSLESLVTNLGDMLQSRFDRLRQFPNLDEAVDLSRRAVELKKDGQRGAALLNNLGHKLKSRYLWLGHVVDMEEALVLTKRAVEMAPDHPYVALWFSNIGSLLELRSDALGEQSDLDEAVDMSRRAVQMTDQDSPYMAALLSNLSNKLDNRFQRLWRPEDSEESIELIRRAIRITPKGSPNIMSWFNNLGNKLRSRYERSGRLVDLQEAVDVMRQAVNATPEDSTHAATMMNNLGSVLQRKFERQGRLADLEEAIKVTRRGLELTPGNSPDLSSWLSNLGGRLERRFVLIGRQADLEEAIEVGRRAIATTPETSVYLPTMLNNLAINLRRRFDRIPSVEDLDESLDAARKALRLTPDDSPDKSSWMNSIASSLGGRFELFGELSDLEEAVKLMRNAVDLTPDASPDKSIFLDNLANKLEARHESHKEASDLEDAIALTRQALEVTPEHRPIRAALFYKLGRRLESRFELLGDTHDQTEAATAFEDAWNSENATVVWRLRTALVRIGLMKQREAFLEAYKIAKEAVSLLMTTMTRTVSLQDQQYIITDFPNLAAEACALRLQVSSKISSEGTPVEEALTLLETGRGSMLRLALEDRIDTTRLAEEYPVNAEKFEESRMLLHKSSLKQKIDFDNLKWQRSHVELQVDFDACIDEIRELPGFESFMRIPAIEEMKAAARGGVIIAVNVTDMRSDAILVQESRIRSLHLERFGVTKIRSWLSKNQEFDAVPGRLDLQGARNSLHRGFLKWLWKSCVKPIMDDLGYGICQSNSPAPRVWWIGAGVASFLPFHAAGEWSPALVSMTIGRVTSSYTPSIRALIHAKARQSQPGKSALSEQKLMLATMPTTPHREDLRGVTTEATAIVDALQRFVSVTLAPQPEAKAVLEKIQSHTMFHFAGHGVCNPVDPLNSGIVFQRFDPASASLESDRLTMAQVLEVDIQPARLAFLSACSTAENRVQRLADESLHLASGFLVAGFSNVIATLWPSSDSVSAEIAGSFYAELAKKIDDGFQDDDCAQALHATMLKVLPKYSKVPLLWAPYIHLGS